jgi:hypothetical protein
MVRSQVPTSRHPLALLGVVIAVALLGPAAVAVRANPEGAQAQLSNMDGSDGAFDASNAQAAFDATTNRTLVVWSGKQPGVSNGQEEIFGRMVDIAGNPVGAQFQISNGPGLANQFARNPAVAWNSSADEFLVTWSGGAGNDEDVYVQRLSAAGAELGADTQISQLGGAGPGTDGDNQRPVVAYNPQANDYLVVWRDSRDVNPGAIIGQGVSAAGQEIGTSDFVISDDAASFDNDRPALAHDSALNRYLVVWQAQITSGEREIYGRYVDAALNVQGATHFAISNQGPSGDPNFNAERPDVVYNSTNGEHFVVWQGTLLFDGSSTREKDKQEIVGQRLAGTGGAVGSPVQISQTGPPTNLDFDADDASVAYHRAGNEYLVVWEGDIFVDPTTVDNENEIFGQRLNASAGEIGTNDFRISTHGPESNPNFDASNPAVVDPPGGCAYLAAWDGTNSFNASATGDDQQEQEIFTRRIQPCEPVTAPPPGRTCRDRLAPITNFHRRDLGVSGSVVSMKGTSRDRGKPCRSGIRVVQVSLARVSGLTGVNCRFVRFRNRYAITPRQNCRKPVLFTATGKKKWKFSFRLHLPPGRYRAQARATDRARNKETPRKRRNIVIFVVR